MNNFNENQKIIGVVERRLFDSHKLNLAKELMKNGGSESEISLLLDWAAKPMFKWNKIGKMANKLFGVDLQIPLFSGIWTRQAIAENLVTTRGKQIVAERIGGTGSQAAIGYIAVGTGTTAAAAGNTALETEITDSGLARAAATVSNVTTTTTNDTEQFVKTFTVTGTKAVTEEGLFDASSSGNMLARQVFSAVNVVNGDSLQITHKITAA